MSDHEPDRPERDLGDDPAHAPGASAGETAPSGHPPEPGSAWGQGDSLFPPPSPMPPAPAPPTPGGYWTGSTPSQPPAYAAPGGFGGGGAPAGPGGYGYGGSTYGQVPSGPRAHLPGWVWPVVALLALVVGLLGGSVGGALVAASAGDSGTGSGGLLHVQRRTAAPLPADNGSIAAVAAKVLPSTVQIVAEYGGKAQGATGSGWVLDNQGHIITNNHVVAQAAQDNGPIEVIDQSGHHSKATVVGRSTVYDLAVLEDADAKKLTPAALGSASQMRVGETVVAIGSPLGLSATVTSGIVSAVDRPVTTGEGQNDNSYINALQTDAAINPGNSGGPLVNLQGQVIGVNSAIASLGSSGGTSDQSGNIGVGFAIPIEQVQVTTDQILRTGHAEYPVIGADVRGTQSSDGAQVTGISPGSPASKSDLKVGDIIRKVDGKPVTGSIDVVVEIRTHVPGDHVKLTIDRGGRSMEVSVGLAAKTG